MEGEKEPRGKRGKMSSLTFWDIVLGIGTESLGSLLFFCFLCVIGIVVFAVVK